MPDPTILVAALAALVSLATAAGAYVVRRRDRAAEGSASVAIARLGEDATIRAQLHDWLEAERENHHECLAEVAKVRAEFWTFRADHAGCRERMAELSQRIQHLETVPPPVVD